MAAVPGTEGLELDGSVAGTAGGPAVLLTQDGVISVAPCPMGGAAGRPADLGRACWTRPRRELHEEPQLDLPESASVLDDYATRSGYVITLPASGVVPTSRIPNLGPRCCLFTAASASRVPARLAVVRVDPRVRPTGRGPSGRRPHPRADGRGAAPVPSRRHRGHRGARRRLRAAGVRLALSATRDGAGRGVVPACGTYCLSSARRDLLPRLGVNQWGAGAFWSGRAVRRVTSPGGGTMSRRSPSAAARHRPAVSACAGGR